MKELIFSIWQSGKNFATREKHVERQKVERDWSILPEICPSGAEEASGAHPAHSQVTTPEKKSCQLS